MNYNDVPYEIFMKFLRHIYSDTLKIDSKSIYDLLSVSLKFSSSNCVCYFSLLIDSMCHPSRRGVSRSLHNKSLSKMSAKSSSMLTHSTVRDSRRHVCCSLRRTMQRLLQVQGLRILTRMKLSRSSDLATVNPTRNKEDQTET